MFLHQQPWSSRSHDQLAKGWWRATKVSWHHLVLKQSVQHRRVTWSGSGGHGKRCSGRLSYSVAPCPDWHGGPCSWSFAARSYGLCAGTASLQGIVGGSQQVCSDRLTRQGKGLAQSTWLRWGVLWRSLQQIQLVHCFLDYVGNWAHGRCSIPLWTPWRGDCWIVGHCQYGWSPGFHVLQRFPWGLRLSLPHCIVMWAFSGQSASWSNSPQVSGTHYRRMSWSQLLGAARVSQVLVWAGVAGEVPVDDVIDTLHRLQPSFWCLHWYQASKHTVWLGTGTWRFPCVLHGLMQVLSPFPVVEWWVLLPVGWVHLLQSERLGGCDRVGVHLAGLWCLRPPGDDGLCQGAK